MNTDTAGNPIYAVPAYCETCGGPMNTAGQCPKQSCEERALHLKRLVDEDAALRPWLIGAALRTADYTLLDRIRLTARETWRAALLSWKMTR